MKSQNFRSRTVYQPLYAIFKSDLSMSVGPTITAEQLVFSFSSAFLMHFFCQKVFYFVSGYFLPVKNISNKANWKWEIVKSFGSNIAASIVLSCGAITRYYNEALIKYEYERSVDNWKATISVVSSQEALCLFISFMAVSCIRAGYAHNSTQIRDHFLKALYRLFLEDIEKQEAGELLPAEIPKLELEQSLSRKNPEPAAHFQWLASMEARLATVEKHLKEEAHHSNDLSQWMEQYGIQTFNRLWSELKEAKFLADRYSQKLFKISAQLNNFGDSLSSITEEPIESIKRLFEENEA